MSRDTLRVLVIDDSAFSRRTIVTMLGRAPGIEVVDWARDGHEALRKALEMDIDLITLDLEMPRMDGFTFLRLLMAKRPTPVLVVSGRAGDEDVFKALDLGAADFVAKPSAHPDPDLAEIEQELLRKVQAIRELRVENLADRQPSGVADPTHAGLVRDRAVVAIGASTGGPAALMQLFGAFQLAPQVPFVVAQHMPGAFTAGFAERLDRLTCFEVREARHGEVLSAGQIRIAPGGKHVEFERVGEQVRTRLSPGTRSDKYAPSVDRLFHSAAEHFGPAVLGVVLTGMGGDGASGARAIRSGGGAVVAESEESAVIFGMPQQAIEAGAVDQVLPLWEIAPAIQAGAGKTDESGSEGLE